MELRLARQFAAEGGHEYKICFLQNLGRTTKELHARRQQAKCLTRREETAYVAFAGQEGMEQNRHFAK